MQTRPNPFSLYDFLGYFVPGAIFTYGSIVAIALKSPDLTFHDVLSRYLSFERLELYLPFVIASYLAGHLLSFVSSATIERYSVWKVGYPSKYLLGLPYPKYFEVEDPKKTRIVVRFLIAVFLAPIALIDLLFGNLFRLRELYAKPLDPVLVDMLRAKVNRLVLEKAELPPDAAREKKIGAGQIDFFRYVYHYAVEHAPAHLPKMQNYVALYGLLRTITLIAVIFFWAAIYFLLAGYLTPASSLTLVALFSSFSFVAFLDFLKFYRRFSLEALMALSAIFPANDVRPHNNSLQRTPPHRAKPIKVVRRRR